MNKLKAVAFDYDGTVVDSHPVLLGAYEHIAQVYGFAAPTPQELGEFFRAATPVAEILGHFFPGPPIGELLAANSRYCQENAHSAIVFEGMKDVLQNLYDRKIPTAVVTGGDALVEKMLEKYGLRHLFAAIVHSGRVTFSKPHPEGFLLASKECGVDPSQMAMVGDSPNDILAGRNGHALATIGMTYGHGSRLDFEAVQADYIVGSTLELQTVLDQIV